jgi:hypothetical protein
MRDPDRANFAALSGSVLAGLLIWAAHFLVIYGATGLACTRGFADARVLGFGVLALTIVAATVLALLAAGAVLVRALRFARRSDGGSIPFLRWMAAMVALLALVAIAWDGLPVLLVSACR